MSILIPIVLLALGYGVGRFNERRHYASIWKREAELADVLVRSTKQLNDGFSSSKFVSGNAVISIDYFKRFAASLKTLFGGRIENYATLIDRARREAVLRMTEDAVTAGYNHIANMRLETSMVFSNAKTGTGSLEVYAYGTALR